MAWLYRWEAGLLPDAVTDTTAKRRRRAATLLGDGYGVFSRLWAQTGELVHAIVQLPRQLNLYLEAPDIARAELELLFGTADRAVHTGRGRGGGLHVHVLMVVTSLEDIPSDGTYGPVWFTPVRDAHHLRALAEYFSRPSDERAARPSRKDRRIYTLEELEQQRLDASEEYQEARQANAGKRLPRLNWQSHVPRLRPDQPTWRPRPVLKARTVIQVQMPVAARVTRRPGKLTFRSVIDQTAKRRWIRPPARAPPAPWGEGSTTTSTAPELDC